MEAILGYANLEYQRIERGVTPLTETARTRILQAIHRAGQGRVETLLQQRRTSEAKRAAWQAPPSVAGMIELLAKREGGLVPLAQATEKGRRAGPLARPAACDRRGTGGSTLAPAGANRSGLWDHGVVRSAAKLARRLPDPTAACVQVAAGRRGPSAHCRSRRDAAGPQSEARFQLLGADPRFTAVRPGRAGEVVSRRAQVFAPPDYPRAGSVGRRSTPCGIPPGSGGRRQTAHATAPPFVS